MCPCPSDDFRLIEKIKFTTDGLADKMKSNLEQVDAVIKGMFRELDNGEKEIEKLFNLVLKDLQHLTQLITDPDQLERDEASLALENVVMVECALMAECSSFLRDDLYYSVRWHQEAKEEGTFGETVYEPLKKEEIEHLNKQDLDEPGLEDQQPQNSLLKSAQENVVKLTQTADEYTSVLAGLKQVEISAKNHMECTEKRIREIVEGELFSFKNVLKDLLKSHREKSGAQVLEEKITKTYQE